MPGPGGGPDRSSNALLRRSPALVALGLMVLGLVVPWPGALALGGIAVIAGRRWPAALWLLVVPLAALLNLGTEIQQRRWVQRYAGRSGAFLYEVQGRGLGTVRCMVLGDETLRVSVPVGFLSFGQYTYGERLWIRGTLEPRDSAAPTLRRYFRGEGRALVLRPQELLERHPPAGWAAHLRERWRRHLQKHLHGPAAGLAVALVLGDRHSLPREVLQDFRRTGTLHLLALSGLHVGLLLLILLVFLQTLRVPFRLSLVLATALLWGYLAVVGPRPSLVRGLLFVSAFALAYVVERPRNYLNFLGVAGVVSLMWAPWWLWSVGFQLSYTATLGILWGMPTLPRIRWAWLQKPWEALWVSLFAQGALVPFLLFYFHGLSLLAPLLNVPLVFLTWLLMAELFLGTVAGPWGAPFLAVAQALAQILLGIVRGAAPWGYVQVPSLSGTGFFLLLAAVIALFILWRKLTAAPFQGRGTGTPEADSR